MTAQRLLVVFTKDEAEGLAELLEMQDNDKGFLELAAELRQFTDDNEQEKDES